MIKKSILIAPLFVAFVLYVLQVRWFDYDSQQFSALRPGQDYPGFLLQGRLWQVVFGLTLAAFAADVWRSIRRIPPAMLIVVVVAVASIAWSIDRGASFNSALLLVVMLGFAVLGERVLGLQRALAIGWWTGVMVLAISTVLALIGDPHALMGGIHAGEWRGLFGHKNQFGPLAATMFMLAVFGGQSLAVPRALRWAVALVAAGALVESGSALAIVALGFGALTGGLALVRPANRNGRILLQGAGMLMVVALGLVFMGSPDELATLLGRNATLTGRTELWTAALPFTLHAPFGYGIGTSGGEQVIQAMRAATGWVEAASSHNSYIRMALDLGWPVTLVFAGLLLTQMAALRQRVARQPAALLAALAAVQLSSGLTEIFGGIYPSLNFLLVLLLAVALAPLRRVEPATALRSVSEA